MLRLIIAFSVLALLGCGSFSANLPLLSIAEAHRVANSTAKHVRVAGFFFHHFEGSSLEPKPGEASVDGILLHWTVRPELEPLKPIATFRGEFVEVIGVLKRGPILGPRIGDVSYLEVAELKRANQ